MCDACDLWYHIGCVGNSHCEYSRYLSLSDFNWIFPVCLFSELPCNEVLSLDFDMKNKCDIPPQFIDIPPQLLFNYL